VKRAVKGPAVTKARPSTEAVLLMLAERGLLADVDRICQENHVLPEEVCSDSRRKKVSATRMRLYAHLRGLGFSLPEVGALLGRDHTTVLYGIRRVA